MIEYDSPKKAQPIIQTIDEVITFLAEYPNSQINLFDNKLKAKVRPAGDSRTDPGEAPRDLGDTLRESNPKKSKKPTEKKDPDKKKTARRKPDSKKEGRDRVAV